MKALWSVVVVTLWVLLWLMPGCSPRQPDTRVADEAAIHALDAAFAKAVETKQLDAAAAYYADDALVMVPGAPMNTTKESVRKTLAEMFMVPGYQMKLHVVKLDFSSSGDIGYLVGTYETTMTDASGNPVADKGKYATVFKKQADGGWKAVVDIMNSDIPAAPPAK